MKLPRGYGRRRSFATNCGRIALNLGVLLPLALLLTIRDTLRARPLLWSVITHPLTAAVLCVIALLELAPGVRRG